MKKRLRLLAWLITLTMLCQMLPFSAFAQSDVGQQLALAAAQSLEEENGEATIIGKCGVNLQWSLSSDGVLTIDGTGRMYYFSLSSAPWSKYSNNIKAVIVNYGTTYIGSYAFYGCSSLISVSIPDSVTSIGEQAFNGCSSLASITMPDSITSIGYGMFTHCASLTSITLSESVTSIDDSAFEWCSSLTSISIPDSVTSIGTYAFYGCPLSDVYYSGAKNQWDKISVDSGNDSLLSAAIHCQDSDTGNDSVFSGKCGENLTWTLSSDGILAIDGTGEMDDYLYVNGSPTCPWSKHLSDIKTVNMNPNVTHIGHLAFYGCTALTSVSIPESVTSIGDAAFEYCSSLASINIPDSVTTIGGSAFNGCISLISINIPGSVTAISHDTFYNCTSLTFVNIPDSVVSIDNGAFYSCSSLTSVNISKSVTCIENDAFSGCSSLASITIPKSITSISDAAFENCSSLSDVYYSGTQEQWGTISFGFGNDDLFNATIHYQSTGPEDEKKFTFGRDNFSFEHNSKDFFGDSNNSAFLISQFNKLSNTPLSTQHYLISSDELKQLTRGLSASDAQAIENETYEPWDGSCYGLTFVSMLHYTHPERLPLGGFDFVNSSNQTIYNLEKPAYSVRNTSLINYYYLTQFHPIVNNLMETRARKCKNHPQKAISEIIDGLNNNSSVFVSLGTHVIILLSILSERDDHYLIRVYDPNTNSDGTTGQNPSKLILYKSTSPNSKSEFPTIKYSGGGHNYNYIEYYFLDNEISEYDFPNYFGYDFAAGETPHYTYPILKLRSDGAFTFSSGSSYFKFFNGEISDCSNNYKDLLIRRTPKDTVNSSADTFTISLPSSEISDSITLQAFSSQESGVDLLLNDTLLSISTSGPVELTYNEADRTVDVTAENPTDVNLLMTKNDVDESWPWHSWALDTTGTTTLHADLDDDGLHLSGDGITNAKYATENADTENVDSGTISVQPDADGITTVTITNKKSSSGDSLEIVTPSAPTTGNAITITNGFAYIDDPEQPVNSAALGDVVTIVANDRSSEGKTFTGWVVNSGDVTLNDSSASPTSFTMGDKAVSITAQYSTNSAPTPTPGGGSSSGGGGGGGAAVLIGVGAAAAITAGVIMMSPVEIKGRVVLADQAAVPGAKISLLREGKVVAQTTADENGSFSLKAKRGSYELTAAYTTADGQLIYKTIDIKAPAKDLTVTF